jgi:hypothetical protein
MHVHVHVGLKLATVFDVMQLNPLPKVICSLQAWKGDDDKSSVVENELLVLKQVGLALKRSVHIYNAGDFHKGPGVLN